MPVMPGDSEGAIRSSPDDFANSQGEGILRTLIIATLALAICGTASAMTLSQYRERMHNQHEWTNRAADNRCRARITWDAFTKHPLRAVAPFWRAKHIYWAKGKHNRMQARSSLCFRDTLLNWYYSSGAKCVHEHEGAWTSNTGNGYYGGFQADLSFASSYGAEYYPPTPDQWTPLQQIHMAYRGWLARGWYPWPNTARMCGLL